MQLLGPNDGFICCGGTNVRSAAEPAGGSWEMSGGTTTAAVSGTPTTERFLGVDVARGIALFAMLAANIWETIDDDDEPTLVAT